MAPNYKPTLLNLCAAAALAAASAAQLSGCARAAAAESPQHSSDLDLTVYKQDFALVHDTRSVTLDSSSSQVVLPNVSKELDPDSLLFDWPGGGEHPEVVSTTYNVGVASSQELMKRLVGQDVDVEWRGQDGRVSERVSGRLEEAGQGTVLHTKDSYLIDPNGEVVVPGDRSFPTMPELVAKVQGGAAGNRQLGMSYLTRGLSWSADYIGVVAGDGKTMKLECWGTVSNQTGTDFPTSKLRLVAGNPNRAATNALFISQRANGRAPQDSDTTTLEMPKMVANTPPPVAAGELYSYEIPAKADIAQGQMNRVRIFHAAIVPIVRTYSVSLPAWTEAAQRHNAQVSISFTNSKTADLGLPLPAGTLRAYDATDGTQAYTGAADIGDTPKDERVSLTLSDAFDVYVKSRQTARKRLAKHVISVSCETTAFNEKKAPVDVRVVQEFGVPIVILNENNKSRELYVGSREWTVHVPAGGQTKIDYTIRMRV